MNLRTIRKEKNLTQAQVASACGVTQCAYSYYEIGKRQPKPDMLVQLAKVFECTVDDILRDDDTGRTGSEAGKTA